MSSLQITPEKILQVGMGFFPSKVMLTAVKLGLFTYLAQGKQTAQWIREKLGLHDRGFYDFLDALVALGFLKREGIKSTAFYSNTEEVDMFLDKNKPSYVGGILEMANNRLYPFWNNLEDALKTGEPQNEARSGDKSIFEIIYADERKLREFLSAMAGVQMGNFMMLAKEFDFTPYKTLCDIGGAGGFLASEVAKNNSHMDCISFDLPVVSVIAEENIGAMGLKNKVTVQSGDFFKDPFPKVDIITMGNILHDWGLEDKKMLIQKSFNALPEGGLLIVIENIIDNERRTNAFGLMMSLNMLIETDQGFDYTLEDFESWAIEAGFKHITSMPLRGSSSAAIARK